MQLFIILGKIKIFKSTKKPWYPLLPILCVPWFCMLVNYGLNWFLKSTPDDDELNGQRPGNPRTSPLPAPATVLPLPSPAPFYPTSTVNTRVFTKRLYYPYMFLSSFKCFCSMLDVPCFYTNWTIHDHWIVPKICPQWSNRCQKVEIVFFVKNFEKLLSVSLIKYSLSSFPPFHCARWISR
jgi:hypothetical protein